MATKRWHLLHPILFAAYPVLFLCAQNIGQMTLLDVIRPLLISTSIAVMLTIILARLTSSPKAAAISISLVCLLFCSYGHAIGWIDGRWDIDPHDAVVWGEMGALALLLWFVWSYRDRLTGVTYGANLVAATLVAIQLGSGGWALATSEPAMVEEPVVAKLALDDRPASDAPDIYYIITDGYARQDVLSRIYGVDNSWFLDSLRGRGFHVSDSSHSNYCQTVLSLASSMNMDYLANLDQVDRNSYSRARPTARLKNSRLVSLLQERGYRTVAFETGYAVTELETADYYLAGGDQITEFESVLLSTTPLAHFVPSFADPFNRHRRRLQFAMRSLSRLSDIPSPKLVFAHLVTPHPPFVFGAGGEALTPSRTYALGDGNDFFIQGGSQEEYIAGYRDQTQYVSERLWQTIRAILSNSSQPPIIVLQSDHGPGSHLHWQLISLTDVQERLSILNCYHIPNLADSMLYPGITPVNSFRVILNHLFDSGFPMMPDSSFYSPLRHPYDFQDVTSRL